MFVWVLWLECLFLVICRKRVCFVIQVVLTDHMAARADLMPQVAATVQVVAIAQAAAAVQVDLTAHEELVALPGHQVLPDLTVLPDLMAQQCPMVQVDLMARLTLQAADLQVDVQHVVWLAFHGDLMAQRGLMAQVHQVDRTAGNSWHCVRNDSVSWRLKIRKRHSITRNSG